MQENENDPPPPQNPAPPPQPPQGVPPGQGAQNAGAGGGNFLQQIGWETKSLTIEKFDGNTNAEDWLRRFTLVADKFHWDDVERLFRLDFYLTGVAGSWVRALPDATKQNFQQLYNAFEQHFVHGQSPIVLESELASRKLGPNESIDSYLAAILDLGSKLNRNPDNLAVAFLMGLPADLKDFCISSDIHTLDNYVIRSRLFQARNPSKKTIKPTEGLAAYVELEDEEDDDNDEGSYDFADLACAVEGLRQDFKKDMQKQRKYVEKWQKKQTEAGRGRGRPFVRGNKNDRRDRSDKDDKKKPADGKQLTCHACGLPGHFMRSCKWHPKNKDKHPRCKNCGLLHKKADCMFPKSGN